MRLLPAVLMVVFLVPQWGGAQTEPEASNAPTQASTPAAPASTPAAQTSTPPAETPGPTAFLQVQGSSTTLGLVTAADINLGYRLSDHLAADIGLPFIMVRSPHSQVTTHDWVWSRLISDPYVDVRYMTTFSGARITSVLTGTIPVKGATQVFSTGRFGVDWFNHVEPQKSIKGFVPFLNLGAASQTISRFYMPRPYSIGRPYQTLGLMGDFEGGGSYKIWRYYKIGASAYALVPGGPQKIFSRTVIPGSGVVGNGNHERIFDTAFETKGTSTIDRDNGYSGWLEVTRFHNFAVQIGYTRSVHYAYDSVTLAVTFNATALFRTLTATGE